MTAFIPAFSSTYHACGNPHIFWSWILIKIILVYCINKDDFYFFYSLFFTRKKSFCSAFKERAENTADQIGADTASYAPAKTAAY